MTSADWSAAQPLIDAIVRDRDDARARAAFAHWLTEHGDPRGALMLEDMAASLEQRPQVQLDQMKAHAAALFGPFADARPPCSIECAFIDALTITPQLTERELEDLAAHSCTTFLRIVRVRALSGRERGVEALLARPVQELRLPDGCDAFIAAIAPCTTVTALSLMEPSAADLRRAFPRLERIYVQGDAAGWRDAP